MTVRVSLITRMGWLSASESKTTHESKLLLDIRTGDRVPRYVKGQKCALAKYNYIHIDESATELLKR